MCEFVGREIFGPRQGALIDALTERLRSGVSLNKHDVVVASWVAGILGLTEGQVGIFLPVGP